MKAETKEGIISGLIISLILIILISIIIFVAEPHSRFWLSEDENSLSWCETYRPMANISLWNNNIKYCYEDAWNVYCRISYPSDCIDNFNMTYNDAKKLYLENKNKEVVK